VRDLKAVLYFVVHGAKKSVAQIADDCGISQSYLYRACLEGEAGCRFPLELLLPLMQSTGDFALLDHLNARAGRITVSLPRVAKLKKKDPQAINDIARNFNAAMAKLLAFYDSPDPAQQADIEADLHRHLCEIAAMKRSVKDFKQGDLL
jgi:hypothetical protein